MQKARSFRRRCGQELTQFDQFARPFRFKLPNNKRVHNTGVGCSLTLLMALILVYYVGLNVIRMSYLQASSFSESVQDSYFTPEDVFTSDIGLNFAFGISGFTEENEVPPYEEPLYGKLVASYQTWGQDETGNYFQKKVPISLDRCSAHELGFGNQTRNNFYQTKETQTRDLNRFYRKFWCLDESISLNGDYNADKGKSLILEWHRCDPSSGAACKDKAEIDAWLKRKFLIVYSNNQRFDSNASGPDKVVKESQLMYVPISTVLAQERAYEIQMSNVEIEREMYWDLLGGLFKQEQQMFQVNYLETRPWDVYENVQIAVSFTMNQNLNVISRRTNQILDLVSSFGGLQAALAMILGVFYKLWTVNEFDNWLVENLFKAEKPDGSHWNDAFKFKETGQAIYSSRLSCCGQLCGRCLKQSKYERIFKVARGRLEKEIDIIRFVKMRRKLNSLFKFQSEQLDEETKKQINLSKYTLLTLDMYKDKDSEDEEEMYQKKMKSLATHEVEANDIFKRSGTKSLKKEDIEKGTKNQVRPIVFEEEEKPKTKAEQDKNYETERASMINFSRAELDESNAEMINNMNNQTNVTMERDVPEEANETPDLQEIPESPHELAQNEYPTDDEPDRKVDQKFVQELEADGGQNKSQSDSGAGKSPPKTQGQANGTHASEEGKDNEFAFELKNSNPQVNLVDLEDLKTPLVIEASPKINEDKPSNQGDVFNEPGQIQSPSLPSLIHNLEQNENQQQDRLEDISDSEQPFPVFRPQKSRTEID